MSALFAPPAIAELHDVGRVLLQQGFAVLTARGVMQGSGLEPEVLQSWVPWWDALPVDAHLKDGGRYRHRRHSCFVVQDGVAKGVPHRPHWQPVEYNALHGGMERHFEPMAADLVQGPAWGKLLVWLAGVASDLRGVQRWYVEAHQFRIDTADGIGRPTPEGAHRDGVDLVAVFLVQRHAVKGGETRVFEADGPMGQRFTLIEPWSVLLLDDARVIHESTPIQPLTAGGFRDTLVVTLRSGGFQGPP